MLTVANISKAFGERVLFNEVSFFVGRGERLGLIGANGAGKTTLFNVILGREPVDEGEVSFERGVEVGFLPQEAEKDAGEWTVLGLALSGGTADGEGGGFGETASALEELHEDEDWGREARAKKILAGLGFKEGDHGRKVSEFSGGWMMRAHIARLLVWGPELLLLDEPTNHLDLPALLWLQEFLGRYEGSVLLISHDRAFLNAVCTGVLELSGCAVERYSGNYDRYLLQREERREAQLALYRKQQREIEHMQSFVDRFGAKASMASRANSRKKQIERLMEEAVEAPVENLKRVRFKFPQPARSGQRVMKLERVRQAYGDHVVYGGDLDLMLERGERVVLVGPNGAGKSTLLKILAGVVPIQGGLRDEGHNVEVGYFSQARVDVLNAKANVLENLMELRDSKNDLTEERARSILGAFLFRKDDVFKPVAVLSGGEKSRLALARLLVNPPNLLLMDEPTTHLDMVSIDALVLALKQFEGSLVFISHDVYFIRELALKVLHVNAGKVTSYAGNYDYYLEKSKAGGEREGLVAGFSDARPTGGREEVPSGGAVRSGPKSKEQKRAEAEARARRAEPLRKAKARVKELEKMIEELELEQASLMEALEKPENHEKSGEIGKLSFELGKVGRALEETMRDWEEATQEVEELGG